MVTSQLIEKISNGGFDNVFVSLYSGSALSRQRDRYIRVLNEFQRLYGEREVMLFSVPGRTELSGNHTDHNRGTVLAASVDIDIIAAASPAEDNVIRMKSEGYREDVIDLSSERVSYRRGSSSALVAGVADWFAKNGYRFGGYRACTASDVMSGSGLSSSAAFEVMCGRILSQFYNGASVAPMDLAKSGQYAENEFFGKPCGLMDQAACANGGCLWIDFSDPENIVTERVKFDLEKHGYRLCIVNTGGNHADLTDDYASVPAEMKQVASLLGKSFLRECDESDFVGRIPELRRAAGDRAVLRALHFFAENKRVNAQLAALKNDDFAEYLRLVKSSGDSSFKFLQNVYTNSNIKEQGVSLALAITERFGAVCRVHGGGFAGTIQAYVPADKAADYKAAVEKIFGENACRVTKIRPYGAVTLGELERI